MVRDSKLPKGLNQRAVLGEIASVEKTKVSCFAGVIVIPEVDIYRRAVGVAPASMLGPLDLNKFVQFPEIPNIFNGPPERIASYLNEINSSMRVSFWRVSLLQELKEALPTSRIPRRTKAQKKLLARGKSCDRLRLVLGTCFSVSGDFTGFQVR